MGSNYSHTTRTTGTTLTATIYNLDHTNHITALTPATMDDESVDLVAMKATADPYPASVASLATSMQGELQRLRYIIAQITGKAFWYIDPDTDLATVNAAIAGDNPLNLVRNGSKEFWGGGTAVAADGWTLTGAAASVAREGTKVASGTYSAKLTRAGTDCHLNQNILTSNPNQAANTFQGNKVAAKVLVWADTASRAKITIDDGVDSTSSSFHTGGSSWEELTVTHTVNGSATQIQIKLELVSGNTTVYFDDVTLVFGATAVDFSPHPSDAVVPLINPQGTPNANQLYKANIVKAWVNFQGSSTVNASFNVASVTDNAAGDFTIVIDQDMADTNYVVAGSMLQKTSVIVGMTMQIKFGTTLAVGSFTIKTLEGGNNVDMNPTMIMIMGNQ